MEKTENPTKEQVSLKLLFMKNHEEFEILELEDRLEMSRRCFKWAPHHYYCMEWIDYPQDIFDKRVPMV